MLRQLRRDAVRHEDEPQAPLLQVCGDPVLERLGLKVVLDERRELVGGGVGVVEARLEAAAQAPGVPVRRGVGRGVKHLADDLAA